MSHCTFVALDMKPKPIRKIALLLVYTHIHPPTPLHSFFMTDSHNNQLASQLANFLSSEMVGPKNYQKPSYKLLKPI
jgi:hypothetical protein